MVEKTRHGYLQDGIFVKKEKERDKLRMADGAWSINLDELPLEAVAIRYITEKYIYTIETEVAHLKGFTRILGGEPKLVVPLKYWKYAEKQTNGKKKTTKVTVGVG